eukprot:754494-Hanusia_phi.AAC.6
MGILLAACMFEDYSSAPVDPPWIRLQSPTTGSFSRILRLAGGQGQTVDDYLNRTKLEGLEDSDKVWEEFEQANYKYNLDHLPRILDEDDNGEFTPEKACKGLFNLVESYLALWPDRSSKNPRHFQPATVWNYSRMEEPNYVHDQMREKLRISADYSTSSRESSSVDSEMIESLCKQAEEKEEALLRRMNPRAVHKEKEKEVEAVRKEIQQRDDVEVPPEIFKDSSDVSSSTESSYASGEVDLYKRFRSRLPIGLLDDDGMQYKPWDVYSEFSSEELDSKTHSDVALALDSHARFTILTGSGPAREEGAMVEADLAEDDQVATSGQLLSLACPCAETSQRGTDRALPLSSRRRNGLPPLRLSKQLLTRGEKCPADHVQQVLEVIKEGGQINVPDRYLWTPLHHAAFRGHAHIIRLV